MLIFDKIIRFSICIIILTGSISSVAKEKIKKSASTLRQPNAQVDRPPQFVLFAFDGSKDTKFWDESVKFAATIPTNNSNKNNLLKFTYFINPTYYLDANYKSNYLTPGLNGKSVSCIGWSDTRDQIPVRVSKTNQAFNLGHEIGSHANSHCDQSGTDKNNPMFGHPWSEADWTSEFDQFNHLLFDVFTVNKFSAPKEYPPRGLAFSEENIKGFRAPLLAVTDGLWPTLKKKQFRYDTSKTSVPTYWPQKQSWGGWNFPLASIKIAGTNRKTLSMDYNWLFFHSAGASKPNLTETERLAFRDQMLDSYKYYFKVNYFGGRAPVHIGHHFSKWNGGAYWEAMKNFAQFVCNKKEVRCVTYSEYADWLDQQSTSNLDAYRKAQFETLPDDKTIKDIAAPLLADVEVISNENGYEAVFSDEHEAKKFKTLGYKVRLDVNFVPYSENLISHKALITQFANTQAVILRATLLNKAGNPINWTTYKVTNIGEDTEAISTPLEDKATQPETADAHNTPE